MNVSKALGAITELIVRYCDPDEIILFGSLAKGNPHPGSDIDLLVIGNFRTSWWLRACELGDLLSQSPIPVDLHLHTREDLVAAAREPFAFLATIQQSGVSIYRRE